MFSKHPLEKLPSSIDSDSLLDALRLAIMAELDAINLYTQIARLTSDEGLKRLFEDVAREEKTHVGEFLEALKRLDEEQVQELIKGSKEAEELLGESTKESTSNTAKADPPRRAGEDPASQENSGLEARIRDTIVKVINSTRILRRHMPSISVGRVNVYSYYKARRGGEELEELALKLDTIARSFTIPERVLRIPEELSAVVSLEAKRFVLLEEEYLIEKLRSEEEASVIEMSDWSEPGSALRDVSRAYTASYREGGAQDYLLLLPLSRFVNLLSFHEKSGVMELERVRRLVGRVLAHPLLKDDEAYLIPLDPYIASVLVSEDLTIAFPGLEASGGYTVRVWEVIGLRVTLPSAIVKLAA